MGSALRKTSLQFLRLTSTTRTTGRAGGGDRFNSILLSLKNIVIVTPFLSDAKTRRRPRLWQCGCEGCEGEGCCRGWALPPTCSGGIKGLDWWSVHFLFFFLCALVLFVLLLHVVGGESECCHRRWPLSPNYSGAFDSACSTKFVRSFLFAVLGVVLV